MSEIFKLLSALLGRPAMDSEFKESDHPRDENGKFGGGASGKSGNATDVSITGNELGSYSDAKELRQKAMGYYKAHLQGKPAHRADIGEIRFSKKGMDETRAFSADTDKLLMFTALRGIIETGDLGKEEKPNHPRKDGIVAFIPISKTVNFKGSPKHVETLVGKDENGNLYYDLFLDNSRKKESPNSNKRQNSGLLEDSAAGVLPAVGINIRIIRPRVNGDRIAFDRVSQRHFDENGFLHVSLCHISKEQIADYYGSEIPGWQKMGLEPNRIYRGYRPASELAKAAATFNGLPLLNEHVKDSAEEPQKDLRIGNLGTDAAFRAPYLDNSLIIQDADAIEALTPSEPGKAAKRELSASYRYDPVFKHGVFLGQRYDFIMTNIRGNHVALVEEGRAGSDVVVADENTINPRRGIIMGLKELLEQLLSALSGGTKAPAPGADEDPNAPPAEKTAEDGDPEAAEDDESEDIAAKLFAYLDTMEDQELAAKVKEIVEAARASEAPAAPVGDEDKPAEDEDAPGEKDKPAMDKKPGKRSVAVKKNGKGSPVTINLAMDANAVAAKIRAGFKAQIEAARDVRPLIGDVDPLAFDSAAQIYGRALTMIGKPSKLSDSKALKELCALACDAKRSASPYPVVSSVLANDSKGDADPAFANLGNIRKA